MKTFCAGIVLGLSLTTVMTAQDKKNEGKGDEDLIQGVWQVVSSENGGKPDDASKGSIVILSKGKVTGKKDGQTLFEGTYKLDPAKKPKWMDAIFKDAKFLGIYELKGDTLTMCFSGNDKERSTRFASEGEGPNKVLNVLKRQKD